MAKPLGIIAIGFGSVGAPADEVERAWIEEAERRLAAIERGDVKTVPWAEARHRIFAR